MDESLNDTMGDSSAEKPWRIVIDARRPYAAVEHEDAVRIAEAVIFVEQAVLKAMNLIRQGNTPLAVQGFQQVRLVLGHWAGEATTLAEQLETAQGEEDAIDEATEA